MKEVMPTLVEKTMHLALTSLLLATCIFYLWMLKGAHDIFAIVVNFKFLTTRRPNTLPLGCLKLLTLMAQLWFLNYNNFLIDFFSLKRF
jgi:hypothetical protein